MDLEKKTQTRQYSSREDYYAESLIYRRGTEFDRQQINLGFPRCITNSKLDSRGEGQGFDGKKPN